jgi:cytochrome c-type biogenesis protein CcmH/NrfG
MNTLRNLLLALTVFSWINLAGPMAHTQAWATGNIGQQTQIAQVETLLATAQDLYNQNNLDQALTNCLKASTLNPQDHRPYVLAGQIYMKQHKGKSASEAFANAIHLQPKSKELYLLKAIADDFRGATDDAVAACRKALEIDPEYAEAYARLGHVLHWRAERRPETIAAYESALKINPRLFSVYESLGAIVLSAEDEKRAEELFRQAMLVDPKHMSGRFALGRLLVKQGRLAEARELWEGRNSDKDSTSPKFIDLLTRAENLKRATEALAQKPNDPDALVDMGLAVMDGEFWVADGRQKRAIVYFKKALELRPKYAKAQHNIVKGYIELAFMHRNENKTVDEELKKLRKLDPALAKEMEEYRKNYVGGLSGTPVNLNQ